MLSKKSIFELLVVGVVSTPLIAQANDLTISNQTRANSTSRLNNGLCSTQILGPENGTTRAGQTKTIKDWQLRLACTGNLENCTANVYMADNCQGPVISTVLFSVTAGIKNYSPPINGYTVQKVNPFYAVIGGG